MSEAISPSTPRARRLAGGGSWREHALRRTLAWGLAAVLSVYLGLAGGGYDIVVRSELGLVIWWLVLLGVLIGALPRAQSTRAAWIAAALLAAFLAWSWIGLSWTGSHERTLDAVCRLSTYLGVFLIGVCAVRADTARALVGGLAAGITIVCGLAVLSKLEPSLFPTDTASSFYATGRLSYPFDYADALGEYAALGLPLVLFMATSGRTLAGRALATAALQPLLLCLALTVSRGGILAAFVGVVAFFALVPDRIPRLPTLAISAGGIAVLMAALLDRPALRDSVAAAPASQRHAMLVIVIAVLVGTALAAALTRFAVHGRRRPAWLRVSRRGAQRVSAAVAAGVVVLVVVGVASGAISEMWSSFKVWEPTSHSNQYFRLLSLSGSHRYQYWQVAWHAFTASPLHGIGPGTFRFYWAQHTTHAEYVLNAHSLWVETLAETGVVGWALLASFFVTIVGGGILRALRAAPERRVVIATATAGVMAFCAAAAFDWIWQMGVVAMVALLLASVTVVGEPSEAGQLAASGPRAWRQRLAAVAPRGGLALGAAVAMVLIAIPLASTVAVRASQRAARAGHLVAALKDADTARAIEPGAASPYLQRALLLQQLDRIPAARTAIRAAIAREPDNSSLWLIASSIATDADRPQEALADYRRAHALNPTSS